MNWELLVLGGILATVSFGLGACIMAALSVRGYDEGHDEGYRKARLAGEASLARARASWEERARFTSPTCDRCPRLAGQQRWIDQLCELVDEQTHTIRRLQHASSTNMPPVRPVRPIVWAWRKERPVATAQETEHPASVSNESLQEALADAGVAT